MRLGGLGGDRDIGAVARGAQPDRKPDAARGAGDEQGLSGKRHRRLTSCATRKAANAARASSDCRRFAKVRRFGIDPPDHIVKLAAQEPPRHRDGAGRQRRDFARRLQRNVIDRGGIDHVVDEACVLRRFGRERTAHDQQAKRRARGPCAAARAGSMPASGMSPSRLNGVANVAFVRGDDVIAMQQHGRADADRKAADRRDQRLLVARRARGETPAVIGRSPPLCAASRNSPISAPAQNAPGAPASMMQRIASFAAASRSAPRHRLIHRLGQRVLLLRPVHRITRTAPSSVTRTCSVMVVSSWPRCRTSGFAAARIHYYRGRCDYSRTLRQYQRTLIRQAGVAMLRAAVSAIRACFGA